ADIHEQKDLVDNLLKKSGIKFTAGYRMEAGYSAGWILEAADFSLLADSEFSQTPLMTMSSNLSLDVQFSPVFRAYHSMTFSWPNLEFTTNEFFTDYTLSDLLYFRMGVQKISWGISRNFPFTDLINRLPDDFDTSDDYANSLIGLKLNIPVGIGGVEVVAFSRGGFIEDLTKPSIDELGCGLKLNLANEHIDLDIGTLFHNSLHYRSFYSAKATLFNFIEVYNEFLFSYDLNYEPLTDDELAEAMEDEDYKMDNQDDFSMNAGIYFDLFEAKLKFNIEYLFNGEESEMDVAGVSFPLYYGHNAAINTSYDFGVLSSSVFLQAKYNFDEQSGILIPGFRITPVDNMQLYLAVPVVLGSAESVYYIDNPDSFDRRFSLSFLARISGKQVISK
ncbi:MAG TPA: hypothetical protein DCO79_10520, partial [Spirochaeta sp.]|nr:hypothetical protein [Spirochaeta sp.]